MPLVVADQLPIEPSRGWKGPVTLHATDTTNLWKTSKRREINAWMKSDCMVGYHLWVRFIEEDGEPAVLFVKFDRQGQRQQGMKSAKTQMNRQFWHMLAANATQQHPIDLQVLYCYHAI